ncbi:MAG: ribonuclease HII [Candidatus Firestonebacteria bacterium GWA2_43_8]|nr:MAG: ribonuclease HII [Candidatus Firestonebacteria bacterium GWA2_43_8]
MPQSEQERLKQLLKIENSRFESGKRILAGVDEVGRGPLAGPVIAAAVSFTREQLTDLSEFAGVNDSKKVKPTLREKLSTIIISRAESYAFGVVDEKEIDKINILQASLKAMELAVKALKTPPELLLIDGPYEIKSPLSQEAIVGGDAKSFVIAAASIIAKVKRDGIMVEYDKEFPMYGFAKHKGYGTREHIAAIRKFGRCRIHRQCFGKNF